MNRRPDVKTEPGAHFRLPLEIRASHSVGRDGLSDNGVVRRTVLIVDDHEGFRASARALLEAEGFEVVGEAADGPGAIEAVAVLRPRVVLLDIQLPGLDGLAVAEQLAAGLDPPAVVLTSSRDPAAYGVRLGMSSARGFIPKSELSGKALLALVG
jgi:DNA-binding NarL/FixJ family response regulator